MDDNEIMQGAEGAGEDSGFLEGWEETSSGPEELNGGGGDQAAREDGAEGAGDGQAPEAAGEDQTGGQQEVRDQEQEDGPQEAAGSTADAGEASEAPRTWTLNHLGQAVTANEADMVTLAQKGLDYDRIRGEYDEARPVMAMFRDFAQRAGMEVGPYLAHIRAQAKQAEGLSEAEARRVVELEDREAAVAAQEEARRQAEAAQRQEQARRQTAEARMAADLREFQEIFPEAAQDPRSIPREVWAEVRNGRSLVGAYARYREARLRADAEAEAQRAAAQRQNQENAARSAGSMRSAGAEAASKDPFMEGWNE